MFMLIGEFGTLLIGAEGAKTPAGVAVSGDPAGGTTRRLPERPRTARAWSGNKHTCKKTLFSEVDDNEA
jgi:hypothetical protein